MKILVVDDEQDILMLMESRLKASGYQVVSAADGPTGLEIARKEKPDLIILDLMLPQMDGYKVCALLKKDTRYAHIPVILFTAKAQEGEKKLGEEAGADAFITKPLNPPVLMAKIQELLAGSRHEARGK